MILERTLKAGTRKSPLALKQIEEVLGLLRVIYPDFKAEIVGMDTYGDKDKVTPISEIEGSDFFTREIDQALLNGEIDFAVHSAKDLPDEITKGLAVAAITKSIDPFDDLVSKGRLPLERLPQGAKVGTSSQRRKDQLKKYRPDFNLIDIRGTIQERLALLEQPDLDAIIVAACALKRLGLEDRIAQRIPFDILKPHPLQGALAIVTREDNQELIGILKVLDGK
ncbi:MAG: hydroxymethylbilane synthase [Candidatus Omnitrophota bacterium]